MVHIPIINNSGYPLPNYESTAAAGLDLRANIDSPITLTSLQRRLILALFPVICCQASFQKYVHRPL